MAKLNILGQKILLDRKPYEIIGVMPCDFEFPLVPGRLNRTELWVPMEPDTGLSSPRAQGGWGFYMVGRLKPGVTPAQAQQDAAAAAREIMRNFPQRFPGAAFIRWFNLWTRPQWRKPGRWCARSFSQ